MKKEGGVARKKYMCNIPVVESLKSEASGQDPPG